MFQYRVWLGEGEEEGEEGEGEEEEGEEEGEGEEGNFFVICYFYDIKNGYV